MIHVRPAEPGDPEILAPRLRLADLREIQASCGLEPLLVLQNGLAWSDPAHAVLDERDNLLGLFGAVPARGEPDFGVVWMLAAPELERHPLSVGRLSRQWVEKLHERYRVLGNFVDARNEVHLRWLRWCGFAMLRLAPQHGVERRPFYEFRKERGQAP